MFEQLWAVCILCVGDVFSHRDLLLPFAWMCEGACGTCVRDCPSRQGRASHYLLPSPSQADVLTSSDHLSNTVNDESLEKWPQAASAANIGEEKGGRGRLSIRGGGGELALHRVMPISARISGSSSSHAPLL